MTEKLSKDLSMIFLFSFIIFLIIIVLVVIMTDGEFKKKTYEKVVIRVLAAITAISCISWIVFLGINENIIKNNRISQNGTEYIYRSEIYSLNQNNETAGSINGRFVLGFGRIQGEIHTDSYYYFYSKNDIGYYFDKLKCDGAYVIETDSIKPCINWVYTYNQDTHTEGGYYKIYVPTGTVKQEYNL